MTPREAMAMPPWPERAPIVHEPHSNPEDGDSCGECHAYERARAAAWEARCRLAVEALDRVANWDQDHNAIYRASTEAREALAAIGDLPPP